MDREERPVEGELVKCKKCGRKILVERPMFGIDHTIKTLVTCWDCLDPKVQERTKARYALDIDALT